MRVAVKVFELERPVSAEETFFIRVRENFRGETMEHTSEKASLESSFDLCFPIIDFLDLELMSSSCIDGVRLASSARLRDRDFVLEHEKSIELEAKLKEFGKSKVSFELTKRDRRKATESDLDGEYVNGKFLALTVESVKPARLALIHVSHDNKTAEFSRYGFNALKSASFLPNAVVLDLRTLGGVWQKFMLFVETESPEFDVVLEDEIPCENPRVRTYQKKPTNRSVVPVLFIVSPECVVTLKSVEISSPLGIENLTSDLDRIAEAVGEPIRICNKMLRFDNTCEFYGDEAGVISSLKVVIKHESENAIDLSFGAISAKGSSSAVCFFNMKRILGNAVVLGEQSLGGCDSFGVVNIEAMPETIGHITIILTSFKSIPLTDFGKVTIAFTDENDRLLIQLPLNMGREPGFFIGTLERVERNNWKFVYFGEPINYKMPAVAAKAAVIRVIPVEDDIEWEEN